MIRASQSDRTEGPKPAQHLRKVPATVARLDCATAFQRIALGCIANIKAHHGSACAGDAEAVHQIRMAITRLRAAVSFFAPMTVDAVWPRIKREIAWLNASLSAARDSDVVILYAQRKRYRAWTGQAGQQSLDQRRIQDHRRLARSLRSGRFQRFMKALLRWIESGPWLVGSARNARDERAEPLQAYSEWKLKHWHRRLVRKGHDLKTMEASRRHRLRIKVKRYRYMLEALMENLPSRRHAKIRHAQRAAKRLQGGLGDLRDLQRFGHVAAALSGEPGNGCPPGYAEQRRELLVEVVTACRSLKKTRPY